MRYFLSLSLLVLAFIANARQITPEEAQAVAQDFFNNSSIEQSRAPRTIRARALNTNQNEENAPYYVFNASDDKGFVIISGDDRAKKILGYSDKGNFDFANMPPQLSALLEQYAESLSKLTSTTTDQSWNTRSQATSQDGGILLETANWGQGYPYNAQCPIIDGVQCPTGCVATAMAIVMKYYNWPAQGKNKWEFKYCGISKDFSESNYDFNSYLDSYSSDVEINTSIANLSNLFRDLGISVNAVYRSNETLAQQSQIGHVLTRFFKYSPNCRYILKRDYESDVWENLIISSLKSNHPIIYSASNTQIGHAFVIDGYKTGMYHINWGWDGRLNGYFSIDALNPSQTEGASLDYDHSMIIGIEPDYDSHEFSEVWLDAGTDRGSSFQPKWLQDAHIGKGMCIDCTDIVSGEPFNLLTEVLNAPTSFSGDVAVALMNSSNQIIEILKSVHIEDRSESPTFGGIPYIYLLEATRWENLVYNGNIEDDFYIQLVAKRDENEKWELVNGTPETPTRLSVHNNEPSVVKHIVTYHGVPIDKEDVIYLDFKVARIGQPEERSFGSSFGVAHLYIDDEYFGNTDDFRFKPPKDKVLNKEPNTKQVRYVDVYYMPQNSLLSKTVENVTPGNLLNCFNENDLLNVYRLKIIGTISNEDILSLYNLESLSELDLSDVTIISNELTQPLPFLRVLLLPNSLNKISYGDFYHEHNTSISYIPKNVTDCGNLYAKDFMVFESPIPPTACFDAIKQDVEWFGRKVPAILIVPKGSASAYQNHNHWGHYAEIIEMDTDDYFDGYFKTGENFIYCSVTNKIKSLTNRNRFIYEGDMIFSEENFRFPYRATKIPLKIEDGLISMIKNNICLPSKYFNGRDFYYVPNEGFITAYNCDFINYIITPSLAPNFSNFSTRALVPPHSSIGLKLKVPDEFNNIIWNRYEMFTMNCDKVNNKVSIAPTLEGITIEKVEINGVPVEPVGTQYDANFSNDINITVFYNFKGQISMATEYTPTFVASLPHNPEETGGIEYIFNNNTLPITIYNISGMIIYNGLGKDLPQLNKGIYIIKQGTKTRKICVR